MCESMQFMNALTLRKGDKNLVGGKFRATINMIRSVKIMYTEWFIQPVYVLRVF